MIDFGGAQGSGNRIFPEWLRARLAAVSTSQVKYRYGSSFFYMAIWIKGKITALPLVPPGVLATRRLFRSITNGFLLRSAWLLLGSGLPSLLPPGTERLSVPGDSFW